CPAGPPNESSATRDQTPNASPMLTPWLATLPSIGTSVIELSLARPVVGLAGGVATPAIERIIEQHAGFELRKIVGIHARQAERGRQQTRSFGSEIKLCGVRGANDGRKTIERFAGQTKLLDHHVEGAALPAMTEEHILDIERRRIEPIGHRLHL